MTASLTVERAAWRLHGFLLAGLAVLGLSTVALFPIAPAGGSMFELGIDRGNLRGLLVVAAICGLLIYAAASTVLVALLGRDRFAVALAHAGTVVGCVFGLTLLLR